MDNYHDIYRSWRYQVLYGIAIVAFVLLVSVSESILTFLLIKIAGFVLVFAVYALAQYWKDMGKLNI